jgi:hypothetical protein
MVIELLWYAKCRNSHSKLVPLNTSTEFLIRQTVPFNPSSGPLNPVVMYLNPSSQILNPHPALVESQPCYWLWWPTFFLVSIISRQISRFNCQICLPWSFQGGKKQVEVFCIIKNSVTVGYQHFQGEAPWRWRWQCPPKRRYSIATLHDVTTRKTWTWTIKQIISFQILVYSPFYDRAPIPSHVYIIFQCNQCR